ncbi:MAG: phosphoribosylformylglycinamidine synthase [Gammaproteobacteria bacterium]|nr:phosphoribosylformylglycinamidine synthase [Gammaproteobacteria bacterium]MYF66975.1 phosphoribosylformylglycinamidine synthase [Gammaproteobacteria bacterium]MYK36407.1 phosphoribosylformylglycinamidine synthase [Gammaproteobacteria bacterium]
MLALPGSGALSPFRRKQLLSRLQAREPGVREVAASFLHLVSIDPQPQGAELDRLRDLLNYGPDWPQPEFDGREEVLLALPRRGSISPWSTKASEIARLCGFPNTHRIERALRYRIASSEPLDREARSELFDRMTQDLLPEGVPLEDLFAPEAPRQPKAVPLLSEGREALERANREMALALSPEEIAYLEAGFGTLGRDPTDTELMMFAQVNSEHCRHKIFNADWWDGEERLEHSLFDLIRLTSAHSPEGLLSAYVDNAAVISGGPAQRLFVSGPRQEYTVVEEPAHTCIKVETHNHPTAISPFPGAATGAGGEIRDGAATGRGARPKAGMTGFTVSDLRIPGAARPWENDLQRPGRLASPLQIMLEAPIGAASFNNEFGRPAVSGYFRCFEQDGARHWGYHKPIMIAGGVSAVRDSDVHKLKSPPGALVVVLGGPAMRIGVGGGSASSRGSGADHEELDYASVQRGNAEMQRRAQEVIDRCCELGLAEESGNPILGIHDVGAGGLSNAIPELLHDSGRGANLAYDAIPSADPGMSPLETWCNEAQERYMLAVDGARLQEFEDLCRRERCPWSLLGRMDDKGRIRLLRKSGQPPVDMPLDLLFGGASGMTMRLSEDLPPTDSLDLDGVDPEEAVKRVLSMPAVADKSFLIHIGDRTVGGLVARDQLIGPWQVPVSDVAVTARDFYGQAGEAMAVGERTPVAVIDPAAASRLALAEALTNIAAADIGKAARVRISANWMAAPAAPGQASALRTAVEALSACCRELKVAAPVGKDSLSMRTSWSNADGREHVVTAPVSLVVTAFAPAGDVRRTLTPELANVPGTRLVLFDLSPGRNRLGGSCLAQAFGRSGGQPADLDDPRLLAALIGTLRELAAEEIALAWHDRSDGGLFVTLCEMAFAGRLGLQLEMPGAGGRALLARLFAEEPGGVLQVHEDHLDRVRSLSRENGLEECLVDLGRVMNSRGGLPRPRDIRIRHRDGKLEFDRVELHRRWSELSYRMQSLRDNPETAEEQYRSLLDENDPGLTAVAGHPPREAGKHRRAPAGGARPRVAILREQGVNGHAEMAAAFTQAGFLAVDVHMSDILGGGEDLSGFQGLAACGGFSYGDVLGAGGGWARSILMNERAREVFARYFETPNRFTLGVCNGCQMLSLISELIPGCEHWPRFTRNRSEQFEARLSIVRVEPSPSVLLAGMEGSLLMIATSHGEGRAEFTTRRQRRACEESSLAACRFVDGHGTPTELYPANPNGSPGGLAGLTSGDGRVTALMPHPERLFRSTQHSWHPPGWGEHGPWMQMFLNARSAID